MVSHSKTVWVLAISGTLILVAIPIFAFPHESYFPDMAFSDDKKTDSFLDDEYGRHLEAMREPSLWELSKKDKSIEVYRVLRLHPRQHPVCIRIVKKGDSINLRLVVLDGVRVDHPGLIAIDNSIVVDANQRTELVHWIEPSRMWELGKDRDRVELIDNNRVLLEGLKGGRYHPVERWTGPDEEIVCQPMCEYILGLAGLFADEPHFETYDFRASGG